VVERQPDNFMAWRALGSLAWQAGDLAGAYRAAQEMLRIAPGRPEVEQSAAVVRRAYEAWRDSTAGEGARRR
jgi:hypothetical protein